VAAFMKKMGWELDVWELDFASLKSHPSFSMEIEREKGLGVVGWTGRQSGGRDLILNGHIDVVPAGDEASWTFSPWKATVSKGHVYGLGTADMKGGLSCALFAAKAIRDAGVWLKGKLIIESVIGEEDGGVGSLAAVLRGHKADAAIIVEPTNLAVAPAQAGALNFRITIPGKAAHGCIREEGVSAIEKFFPVYEALMRLERERNQKLKLPLYARYSLPYAICVGTLTAGRWASTVADSLTFQGRYGVAVGEDVPRAKTLFEETIRKAAQEDGWLRENPPRLDWWGGQFEPAATDPGHPIVQCVQKACTEVSGKEIPVEGMTYGADMRLLVNEGKIPTVIFGPGDVRQAHRPDEHVPIAHLETAVKTLALVALRFCGYEQ
jgi:acetylornithine deacetylase